ncbi:hypothetical protein SASPL_150411 [Salvia splendens]|uniref:Uncharacterized protein n=1 Tax=Salvia splendens TaxID=180675 RepID=A0A8X8W7A5_SALSN|nr:hypothetical protein SASPL_150411 [Salvia splendens]
MSSLVNLGELEEAQASCEAVDHAKRLKEHPMLSLSGAEVDQIGYDIMQERCGCACIVKFHHLTSHDISSSYESLLWGMRFDFSSPQKGVEDESFNFRQLDIT